MELATPAQARSSVSSTKSVVRVYERRRAAIEDAGLTFFKVTSLSNKVNRDDIRHLFVLLGDIKYINVTSSLFVSGTQEAIIDYVDAADATLALYLSGTMLADRPFVVTRQTTSVTDIPPVISLNIKHPIMDHGKQELISRTVYVGNLSIDITEDEIVQFFAPAGKVELVKLAGDIDKNRGVRFAFVEFDSSETASAAVAMSGAMLKDMSLKVNHSKSPISRSHVQPRQALAHDYPNWPSSAPRDKTGSSRRRRSRSRSRSRSRNRRNDDRSSTTRRSRHRSSDRRRDRSRDRDWNRDRDRDRNRERDIERDRRDRQPSRSRDKNRERESERPSRTHPIGEPTSSSHRSSDRIHGKDRKQDVKPVSDQSRSKETESSKHTVRLKSNEESIVNRGDNSDHPTISKRRKGDAPQK